MDAGPADPRRWTPRWSARPGSGCAGCCLVSRVALAVSAPAGRPARSGWPCGRWTRWPRWPRRSPQGNRGLPAGADPDRHRDRPDGPGVRRDAGRARGCGDPGPAGRGTQPPAFLADAAHELRTPITGVQAAAETLLHHGDTLPAAEPRAPAGAAGPRGPAGRHPDLATCWPPPGWMPGVELHTEPVSLGHLAAGELERVRLLHPEAQVSTGSGPDVVVTADADKVARHPAQRRRQRRPGRGPAGPDPPRPQHGGRVRGAGPVGLRTGRAAERSGSASSSGWSGWTTAAPPTPAAPASGWPSPAATPGPTVATWSASTPAAPAPCSG